VSPVETDEAATSGLQEVTEVAGVASA